MQGQTFDVSCNLSFEYVQSFFSAIRSHSQAFAALHSTEYTPLEVKTSVCVALKKMCMYWYAAIDLKICIGKVISFYAVEINFNYFCFLTVWSLTNSFMASMLCVSPGLNICC